MGGVDFDSGRARIEPVHAQILEFLRKFRTGHGVGCGVPLPRRIVGLQRMCHVAGFVLVPLRIALVKHIPVPAEKHGDATTIVFVQQSLHLVGGVGAEIVDQNKGSSSRQQAVRHAQKHGGGGHIKGSLLTVIGKAEGVEELFLDCILFQHGNPKATAQLLRHGAFARCGHACDQNQSHAFAPFLDFAMATYPLATSVIAAKSRFFSRLGSPNFVPMPNPQAPASA